MKIGQISLYYQPIQGGQQVYIENLRKIFSKRTIESTIYQPSRKGVKGTGIECVPSLRRLNRVIRDQDQVTFMLMLALLKRRSLAKQDCIIAHYAFFSLPVWNMRDKLIILSHGIEWHDDGNFIDRLHRRVAEKALHKYATVANDTDYYRHLGMDIAAGTNYFCKLAPNKWFIPNCVDTRVFRRQGRVKSLARDKIVLVPRQITEDRGIDLAIRAFYLFRKQMDGYVLVIVGAPTYGRYYEGCVRLARELKIEDKVVFAGFVENREMPDYYSSAELAIIPTLRREGTSLSALESMACETVTVSTNVAGLRDLPTLQARPDAQDLAEKMVYALKNSDELKRSQHSTVKTLFNMENWERAWFSVIDSLNCGRSQS